MDLPAGFCTETLPPTPTAPHLRCLANLHPNFPLNFQARAQASCTCSRPWVCFRGAKLIYYVILRVKALDGYKVSGGPEDAPMPSPDRLCTAVDRG